MATQPTGLPRFASEDVANGPLGGNNVIEPSEAKKDSGWNYSERPAREWLNWFQRKTYQWILWLKDWVLTSGGVVDHFGYDTDLTTGLNFRISTGKFKTTPTTAASFAASTIALTASTTNYILLNPSTGPYKSLTLPGSGVNDILLYTIVTGASDITSITDNRSWAGHPSTIANLTGSVSISSVTGAITAELPTTVSQAYELKDGATIYQQVDTASATTAQRLFQLSNLSHIASIVDLPGASITEASADTQGSLPLTNGMVLKFGIFDPAAGNWTSTSVSFTEPFSRIYGVFVQDIHPSGNTSDNGSAVYDVTVDDFTVYAGDASGSMDKFYWFAIGLR
jgi:hypothetical protein